MSNLGDINAINILCYGEDAATADRAAGRYDANIAADPQYYLWQGQQRMMPLGMDGDPEGFAAGLRASLPGVNTLRLTFNAWAFDAQGALHPQYERFLAAAAAQGFRLLLTYADGDQQQLGADRSLTTAEMKTALEQDVQARALATWDRMMDWLDRHPGVKNAVWGYELANEPAAYERAVELAPQGTKGAAEAQFVALYARHMAALADVIAPRDDGRILVGGWAYSAQFDDLAEERVGAQSALDFLRAEIGPRLVWAAHVYPGWHAEKGETDPAAYAAALDRAMSFLGKDDIMLTEISFPGQSLNDFSQAGNATQLLSRLQEFWADRGIGLGWFSGAEAGASSLVRIDPGRPAWYLHQHSLAFALNGFSLDDAPAAHAGAERMQATLREARLRNENYEGGGVDPVTKVGFAFGHGGNDTLLGGAGANNFLYGGRGHDRATGAGAEDFLFGQSGADSLSGGAGADLLFGGRGDDLLRGGAGGDTLEGGAGADRFDARAGSDLITDFDAAAGDRLFLGRGYGNWASVQARLSFAAINGAAVNDVVIRHADGTTTTLLDARGKLGGAALLWAGAADRVDGTAAADRIVAGFEDIDGQVYGPALRQVAGGAGNDTLRGTGAADRLLGGDGTDLLTGAGGNDRLLGGRGADRLLGAAGADSLTGGEGRDTLSGGDGADLIAGNRGADRLVGGRGNDRLLGGDGADWLSGGAGADRLLGGAGADTLLGGAGADHLTSGTARSQLRGGAGNDTLVARIGDSGHDLWGGAGRDSFVFTGADAVGRHRSVIHDFTPGEDRLIVGGKVLDLGDLPARMALHETAQGTVLTLSPGNSVFLDDLFL